EIKKSFTKAYREKTDIKELKLEEHQGGLDSNEILEEGKTPLKIFRENKNKIPYCKKEAYNFGRTHNDKESTQRD
ncbi:25211_t:CDS:2, partial [Racocetra persica]